MHKIYENNDLMMYFKKRYCHCCGGVLSTKRSERIVREGDSDHDEYCSIGTHYHFYGDILVIGKDYYCPCCDKSFSCDEQGDIIVAQKYYKRNIVTDEEIVNAYNKRAEIKCENILKMRWLLLIPLVGWVICFYKINDTYLRKKRGDDAYIAFFSSIFALIGVGLLMKAIIPIINVEFISKNSYYFSLITSLFASNIVMLCYINRVFKNKK